MSKNLFSRFGILIMFLFGASGLSLAQVYTFTNAGATGINGPTQAQLNTEYASTSLAGQVTSQNGIQLWNVPLSGLYKIEVYGAEGYGTLAGKGAYMSGEFNFIANDQLKILVGQRGGCCQSSGTNQYGGGGGSFVVTGTNTPLIIAGGGGGAIGNTAILPTSHGSIATAGNAGNANGTPVAGGTNGNGGSGSSSAGGGGGFSGDGGATAPAPGGLSFLNGGQGGNAGTTSGGWGGFGGGGGANSWDNRRGGGGGGYSGGGGAGSATSGEYVGGGGGSYNIGANQLNTAGARSGHGLVVITLLQPAVMVPNNIGVTAIPSLASGICAGNNQVTATVMNFGNNTIDSAYIGWSVNNVPQPSVWVTFTPSLNTAGNPNSSATVNIGSYNFTSGTHVVKVWSTLPNNQIDTVRSNDTTTLTITTKLNGTYTINRNAAASSTNYISFDALAADLNSKGVCGPVTVNVVAGSGPYTERFDLSNIPGSSATNTIRINGNGNTLQFNATSTTNMPIVSLNGTSYLTIDSLHIKTMNATYGWGIFFTGGAHHDTIRNCHIDLSTITGTSSVNANGIVMNGSNSTMSSTGYNANNIYIANNIINGGSSTVANGAYYGIYMYGQSSSAFGTDTIHIINNEIKNFYYYGIYGYYNRVVNIEGNNIHKTGRTAMNANYGIYLYYSSAAKIVGNRIHDFSTPSTTGTSSVYPIYLYGPTYDNNAANATLIANNAIYNLGNYGGTFYGIYASQGYHTNIYHNTISQNFTTSGTSTEYGIYVSNSSGTFNVKNNIVDFKGGNTATKYGIYISSTSALAANGLQMNTVNMASTQSGTQYRTYYGTAYTDLAALRAAYPALEVNTVDVDPIFQNLTIGDVTPMNSSLYRTGENLTAIVPRDLVNTLRPITPTIGAMEMLPPPDRDLAITEFTNPLVFCGGQEDIKVIVNNQGTQNITSFTINWTLNNVAQTPYTWTGTLASNNSLEITLANLNLLPLTVYDFEFRVASVNNNTDQRSFNDTLRVQNLRSSLSGTFTIDRNAPVSASNYQSFSALANDLNNFGVCGPVIVNVVAGSGPYTDRLVLNDIRGTSEINTITINGNENTLQFNSTAQATMHMVLFNGTKHVKIDNLKIKTLNATYGFGILFTNGAANDSITNCHIDLSTITGTSSTNASAIAFSSSLTSATGSGNNARNIYIGNNLIDAGHPTTNGGAYYGISVYGTGSANYGTDSIFIVNNELRNFYYYGIYAYYCGDLYIIGNNVHKTTKTATTTNYGIFSYYTTGEISNNKVHDLSPLVPTNTNTQYGIQVGYMNQSTTYGKKLYKVTNNAIYNIGNSGTLYGLYVYAGDSAYIAHNTLHINVGTGTSTSTQYGMYIYNTTNSYQVRNNNVSFSAGNTGTKYGIYNANSTMYNTNAGLQNNNVFMNSSRTGTQNRTYYGAAYATLAAFRAAYPTLEVNGIDADPQYLNAANGDLTPMNTAVLMQGEDLTTIVPEDIRGYNRPVPPTPGAFDLSPEFWNNAGVASLVAPTGNFCSGYRTVQVQVKNEGFNDIDTLTINWTFNGVPQAPLLYTTTIDGTQTSNVNTANVSLGTVFVPYGYPSTLKIWTSLPNNQQDDYNSNDTITVSIEPTSTLALNLGNDTTLCNGDILRLDGGLATETFYQYLWDNTSTNFRREITTTGRYWLIKTDTRTGCSGHDTISVQFNPTPTVDLGPNISICPGDSALLDVGAANAANNVLWNDNDTAHQKYVHTPGNYNVVVTNQYGCSASDDIRIIGKDTVFHDGINAVYMLNATYNFNVKNPLNIDYVVWNYGDGSPEDTGFQVTHQYAREGKYTVTAKMYSSCSNASYESYSETLDAIGLGVNNIAIKAGLDIYPNPAHNNINVSVKEGFSIEQVIVYNVLGQQVAKYNFPGTSTKANLNLEGLASGIYNMQVVTDKGVMQAKFEILK